MILRGSIRRSLLGAIAVVAVLVPMSDSSATLVRASSNNSRTLDVSLPGPFNGCTFLNAGASPTTDAISDLILPSAFLTSGAGNPVGENGPIASAELTSLAPETIRYTIAPNMFWSNGAKFTVSDIVSWWLRARRLESVRGDGYRDIKSLTVSRDALSVNAVFVSPYADWNLLFRDVEARSARGGCAIGALLTRPSLGPYWVASAATNRIVLNLNRQWPLDASRFGRIVITDVSAIPTKASTQFANFSLTVTQSLVQALSSHPTVLSHIGSSNNIVEMSFAAERPFARRIAVREALSWSIDRQSLINKLWGAVTFSSTAALSALYSQGQSDYPDPNGNGPGPQATTTSSTIPTSASNGLADCNACARALLSSSGFLRTANGWVTINGRPLVLRLAVGPSSVDHSAAVGAVRMWKRAGITVNSYNVRSEIDAAVATATNNADVSIFSRPTISAVSFAARSWSGPGYADAYPSGWRSVANTTLFSQALSNFNPVTASSTWLTMDQNIQHAYWVRPLFTTPSLLVWSQSLVGVLGSSSVPGLVDQIPLWTTMPFPKS